METFAIEFETQLAGEETGERSEAADALAEWTTGLVEAPAVDVSIEPTPAPDNGSQPSAEIVTATSEFAPLSATEIEAAIVAALRKTRGASVHYLGETVGAYVGCMLGARRLKPFSNHHDLGGVAFQIRTINGTQNTFTVNRDTEPDKIIVAAKKRDKNLNDVSRYILYGVLRDDALARAKKSQSKGHVKSGPQQVSLTQVTKVELGSILIPDELVLADTADQRLRLLDRINALERDLSNPTVEAARAFLAARSVYTAQSTVEAEAPEASATEVTTPKSLNKAGKAI